MYEVSLESLHAHIHYLEMQLLQPNIRQSRDELDRLFAEDFVEFGSSGRVYDKETAIASMIGEQQTPQYVFDAEIHDLKVKPLAPDLVLATYRLKVVSHTLQRKSFSLRSSIWKHEDGKWRLVFHQGTPTQEF